MRKFLLILSSFLFLLSYCCSAQQQGWKWGKHGGGFGVPEYIYDICTDHWGNVYTASYMHKDQSFPSDVDYHLLPFMNYYSPSDIVVSSWDCDGNYRWSTVVDGGHWDYASALRADTLGGIYLSAETDNYHFHDTIPYVIYVNTDTINCDSSRTLFVVKLDTAGDFQWLYRPQDHVPNFKAWSNYSGIIDIDVDESGTQRLLCYLFAGNYGNGGLVVTDTAFYQLQYDAAGNFQSGFKFEMESDTWMASDYYMLMSRDHSNGRYYISYNPQNVGFMYLGNQQSYGGVACFDSAGHFLWKQECETWCNMSKLVRPSVDDSGFLYVTGDVYMTDSIAGYVPQNTICTQFCTSPIVAKLDSAGALQWAITGSHTYGLLTLGIAVRSAHEVAVAGRYNYNMGWTDYTGPVPEHATVNTSLDMFLLRVNRHTGNVIAVDTTGGAYNWGDDVPERTVCDRNGNIYIAGKYEDYMVLGTADTIDHGIDENDFFLVKYGGDCCVLPQPSFTYDPWTTGLVYTGSQQYDSILWVIDGVDSTMNNTPVAGNMGPHGVCVTIITPCGDFTFCDSIFVPESVAGLSAFPDVKLYPNPATDILYVDHIDAGVQYTLSGITGNVIEQGTFHKGRNEIRAAQLAQGVYMLQLGSGERRGVVRVVK